MISVCIASYNGGKFIAQQLRSVLPQLGETDEVIISDDGSSDNTLDEIAKLNDSRIQVIKGPSLHSPTKNFENAITHSKGDYIFLCDQDDVWTDNKVNVMMKAMEKYACVVSDCYVTDGQLNIKSESFRESMGFRNERWYNLLVKNSYSGSCMAFRREVAEKALPVPEGILMHDIWIGNVAAYCFSLVFIPEKLMYFRRHEDSTSTAGHKSNNPIFARLASRFRTAKGIVKLKYFK